MLLDSFSKIFDYLTEKNKWSLVILFTFCSIIPGILFLFYLDPRFITKLDIFKILLLSLTITLPLTGIFFFVDCAFRVAYEKVEKLEYDSILLASLLFQAEMTTFTAFIIATIDYNYYVFIIHIFGWSVIYTLIIFHSSYRRKKINESKYIKVEKKSKKNLVFIKKHSYGFVLIIVLFSLIGFIGFSLSYPHAFLPYKKTGVITLFGSAIGAFLSLTVALFVIEVNKNEKIKDERNKVNFEFISLLTNFSMMLLDAKIATENFLEKTNDKNLMQNINYAKAKALRELTYIEVFCEFHYINKIDRELKIYLNQLNDYMNRIMDDNEFTLVEFGIKVKCRNKMSSILEEIEKIIEIEKSRIIKL